MKRNMYFSVSTRITWKVYWIISLQSAVSYLRNEVEKIQVGITILFSSLRFLLFSFAVVTHFWWTGYSSFLSFCTFPPPLPVITVTRTKNLCSQFIFNLYYCLPTDKVRGRHLSLNSILANTGKCLQLFLYQNRDDTQFWSHRIIFKTAFKISAFPLLDIPAWDSLLEAGYPGQAKTNYLLNLRKKWGSSTSHIQTHAWNNCLWISLPSLQVQRGGGYLYWVTCKE